MYPCARMVLWIRVLWLGLQLHCSQLLPPPLVSLCVLQDRAALYALPFSGHLTFRLFFATDLDSSRLTPLHCPIVVGEILQICSCKDRDSLQHQCWRVLRI